jgi:hypothetical protein
VFSFENDSEIETDSTSRRMKFKHVQCKNSFQYSHTKQLFPDTPICFHSRDSSVDIEKSYRLDGRRSIPDRVKVFFSSQGLTGSVAHPASIQWVSEAVFPRVKLPRHDADRSRPSSTEVKNGGVIPPLSHMSSWRGA